MPTVSVVIIGDEILSGKFADENGPYLIRRLRELGADLEHLAVVSDEVERIAEEVARCAARSDWVLTTGGVGPTHDDVTLEGIGVAVERPLHRHPELVALLERFGMELNEAALRMATVPMDSQLIWEGELGYPVLQVDNIFVFPGVPRLMRAKFEAICTRFEGSAVHTARVQTHRRETDIASVLSEVQDRMPAVAIGSYPRYDDGPRHVIVTIEGRDREAVEAARLALASALDEDE